MRAGALDQRVTIQARGGEDDGRGGKTVGEWAAIPNGERVPARVTPLSGEERIVAMQQQAGVTHEVEIRYRAGVKADHRLLWHLGDGDRPMEIVSGPMIVGRQVGLRFQVREAQ